MTHHVIDELADPVAIGQETRQKRIERAKCQRCGNEAILLNRDASGDIYCDCPKCGWTWGVGTTRKKKEDA